MDQSKWAVPRCRHHQIPKSVAKFERPKSKVQGVWCHGVILCLYVLSPRASCDGSMVVECLMKAFDKVKEICERRGRTPPKRIVLWVLRQQKSFFFGVIKTGTNHSEPTKVDNTVKEGKNNTVLKALSFALLQRGLEFTALFMSRVGHTHNSLGAWAG